MDLLHVSIAERKKISLKFNWLAPTDQDLEMFTVVSLMLILQPALLILLVELFFLKKKKTMNIKVLTFLTP